MSTIAIDKIKIIKKIGTALSHPVRYKIWKYLADHGEANVSMIAAMHRIDHPVASVFLAPLLKSKLINLRVDGRLHFFSANQKMLEVINTSFDKIIECQQSEDSRKTTKAER